jgi:hypothetical protein
MVVLEKELNQVNFFLDLSYFHLNNYLELKEDFGTQSSWRRDEKNSFVLAFKSYYNAKNNNGIKVINYVTELKVKCLFEVIEEDAEGIVNMKQQAKFGLFEFLEEKMGFFYSALKAPKHILLDSIQFEDNKEREINSIKRIMDTTPYENMTDEQKQIAKLSQAITPNFQ